MRKQAFKIKSFSKRAEVKQQSEAMLRRCIELDPTDARAYNALGKHMQLERRFEEAGKVYDDGLAVTGLTLKVHCLLVFPSPGIHIFSCVVATSCTEDSGILCAQNGVNMIMIALWSMPLRRLP